MTWVLLAIVVVIGLWVVLSYNRLISLVNQSKEAWADIDVQLKRRYDLIPNLVNTVKGYAAHESKTFEQVTAARTRAMNASGNGAGAGANTQERLQAENEITGALKSIFALAEAYPDLKANQNFLELQRELSDTENKIQAARRFYNGNVRDLTTAIQSFPSNIIAKTFGFSSMNYFELTEGEQAARNPVEVKF